MNVKFVDNDKITSEEELLKLIGTPSQLVKNKVINYLDENCQTFISLSPFVVLSTSNQKGECDASPRGDHPGFVKILDNHHLLIPDRPGNKRTDSIRNIISNPHVGMLFVIPSLEETLRINGKAWITKSEALLESLAVNGRTPQFGICIEVEECFIHCAKAFKRSSLWNSQSWPSKDALPSPAKILAQHAKFNETEVQSILKESYTQRLY